MKVKYFSASTFRCLVVFKVSGSGEPEIKVKMNAYLDNKCLSSENRQTFHKDYYGAASLCFEKININSILDYFKLNK